MIAHLAQQVRDARRRISMAIGRGVLAAINDATQAQEVQIQLLDGEVADEIERFGQYGLTSVPFPGAEAVMVGVGGLRSHGIVIAVEDRRYRLKGLQNGEVALYDDLQQKVHLTRTGISIATPLAVDIQSGGEMTFTAPKVIIDAEVEITHSLDVGENVAAGNGATGSFPTASGQMVTVMDGSITNIF